MADVFVSRFFDNLLGQNTIVVQTLPVRFQIAPGRGSGLGIAGAPFVISAAGVEISRGVTNAEGEVGVPVIPLFVGNVTVRIFDTDYLVSLTPVTPVDKLLGQEQRLDALGYFTGYQITAPRRDPQPATRQEEETQPPTRTESAFMNFQTDENLAVDGRFGPNTSAKLREASGFP